MHDQLAGCGAAPTDRWEQPSEGPCLDIAGHALCLVLAPALIEHHPHDNAGEGDVLLNHGRELLLKVCLRGCIDGAVGSPAIGIPGACDNMTSASADSHLHLNTMHHAIASTACQGQQLLEEQITASA